MEGLIEVARPYTKSGTERLESMVQACQKVAEENIPGDVVECGVWRAGNIILARKMLPDRTCWLYDTFTGMTKPTQDDVSRAGVRATEKFELRRLQGAPPWCGASLGEVRGYLEETGTLDDSKLKFVVGDICKTLRDPKNVPDQISVLRLDTDWYESTRDELKILYPKLSIGGVLIVDDYGHWLGARKAVDEYFKGRVEIEKIDYTAVRIVKLC